MSKGEASRVKNGSAATAYAYAQEDAPLFRLPAAHLDDLYDVARGVEETDAGVCCSYLVDSRSGEGADFDEHALNALERYAEQSLTFEFLSSAFGAPRVANWRARISRCRRTIAALHEKGDHRAVSVLFVAYGYPDPIVRQLPDLLELGYVLAPLAKYTEAVEERRFELAASEAQWTGKPFPWVLGSTSSGDGLRYALSAFPEEGVVQAVKESYPSFEKRKAERRQRELAWRERKEAFLSRLRLETVVMLSEAERSYHDAWLRASSTRVDGYFPERRIERRRDPVLPPARVRGSGWSVGHE